MRRTLLATIILTLSILSSKAQDFYQFEDFSDKYFGRLYVSSDETSPWQIVIFNRNTNRKIIEQAVDSMYIEDMSDGKLPVNLKEPPYGRHGLLMYEDYNFDGKKDFALRDGDHSGYDGPSFQIYLAAGSGFVHNKEFTRLAQEYLSIFDVDYEKKQLHTIRKDGCCWNEYSTFVVENNRPVAVKIVEVGPGVEYALTYDFTEHERVNGKMVTTKYHIFDTENEEDVLFSFKFSNGKKMRLIWRSLYLDYEDGAPHNHLLYFFTDKNDRVELFADWDTNFRYSEDDNRLEFDVGATTYAITQEGIIATTPNHKYDMKAVPETRKGSLAIILEYDFENLLIN